MIDHLIGRPSPSWKRAQVILVIVFWVWRIINGNPGGPRLLWLRRANRALQRFQPWQIIVSTLTGVYAMRNIDKILGLNAPEPLASLYSPSYFRSVWIATGLDAGFATAMSIRPKWLREICSILFSLYYIVYASEAQEKIRRYRAVPTVEMLRTTWEKTTNPYIRAITYLPKVSIARKILLQRPRDSIYQRPITAWLFFAPPEHQLARATDLILDFPGGGFVAMTPQHHEERLRMWAVHTGKPVLAIDYGKAPEYPYPFSSDEAFDVYRVLVESSGTVIGMSGRRLQVILTGDSAGATLAVNVINQILATQASRGLTKPRALVLNYAALDFNFTSWMSPANLRVLRSAQSAGDLAGNVAAARDHFARASPLSMVSERPRTHLRRRRSWRDVGARRQHAKSVSIQEDSGALTDDGGAMADAEGEGLPMSTHADTAVKPEEKANEDRVRYPPLSQSTLERKQVEFSVPPSEKKEGEKALIGTRMTMTSRTGYFQDKIITPSMMRAMALLYIGPTRNPDFATDYHISPILTPLELLAQYPPLLMQCGEKDPFVDDTCVFAGRVREAKRARKRELDVLLAGKSARFGEALRMSQAEPMGEELRKLRHERDRLAGEGEEDWVRMVIYEDWSHGYLQMATLMPEARAVITDIAEWMDETFGVPEAGTAGPSKHREGPRSPHRTEGYRAHQLSPLASETEVTETEGESGGSPIVFMPRRLRTPRASFSNEKRRAPRRSRSRHSGSDEVPLRRSPRSDETLLDDGVTTDDGGVRETPTVALTPTGTGPGTPAGGKPGNTLTESELMKRRRLLDAHLLQ